MHPGSDDPDRLTMDPTRTYVEMRYVRHPWAALPIDAITPLGTLRAHSLAQARVNASARWPDERAAELLVRRASACRPAVLLGPLEADGVRLLGPAPDREAP